MEPSGLVDSQSEIYISLLVLSVYIHFCLFFWQTYARGFNASLSIWE